MQPNILLSFKTRIKMKCHHEQWWPISAQCALLCQLCRWDVFLEWPKSLIRWRFIFQSIAKMTSSLVPNYCQKYMHCIPIHCSDCTFAVHHYTVMWLLVGILYSRVRNKCSPTIINFLTFFQGLRPYSRLHSIR